MLVCHHQHQTLILLGKRHLVDWPLVINEEAIMRNLIGTISCCISGWRLHARAHTRYHAVGQFNISENKSQAMTLKIA